MSAPIKVLNVIINIVIFIFLLYSGSVSVSNGLPLLIHGLQTQTSILAPVIQTFIGIYCFSLIIQGKSQLIEIE